MHNTHHRRICPTATAIPPARPWTHLCIISKLRCRCRCKPKLRVRCKCRTQAYKLKRTRTLDSVERGRVPWATLTCQSISSVRRICSTLLCGAVPTTAHGSRPWIQRSRTTWVLVRVVETIGEAVFTHLQMINNDGIPNKRTFLGGHETGWQSRRIISYAFSLSST